MVGIGFLEWVGIRDAAGAKINPATQETLAALKTRADLLATQITLAELDASFGDTTDAGVIAGGAGTAQAKLRKLTSQLNDLANLIGEVAANPTSNTVQDRLKRAVTALEVDIAKERTSGQAMPSKVTPVGGTDGVDLKAMRVDSDGHPQIDILSGGGIEPVNQTVILDSATPTGPSIETNGNRCLTIHAANSTGFNSMWVEESNDGVTWNRVPISPLNTRGPGEPVDDVLVGIIATGNDHYVTSSVSSRFIRVVGSGGGFGQGEQITAEIHLSPGPSRQTWVAGQSGNLANGFESVVGGTASQIMAANLDRRALIVQNIGAANMRVGAPGVTATSGLRLVPGGHVVFSAPAVTSAVNAIREGSIDTRVFVQEVA